MSSARRLATTRVAVPSWLVLRIVFGIILAAGGGAFLIGGLVSAPAAWPTYVIAGVVFVLWLTVVVLTLASGVYLRKGGVTIVNPFSVRSLAWDRIRRFTLEERPTAVGRVDLERGGSVSAWGVRGIDPHGMQQVREAIDYLNQELERKRSG